jgi:glycosyltransferase involved in cell wall biosynthesis
MISVAMAVYNGEQYITEQLDSIFHQERPVDEVVICDDRSNDRTAAIIETYQKTHDVPIRLLRNEKNLGYKLNFKKAMAACRGDYIFLCDQDDHWDRDKTKKMMQIMESRPDILVLASSFRYMDADDQVIEVKPLPGFSNNNLYTKPVEPGALVQVHLDEFLTHNYFQGCALVIRRSLCDEVLTHFTTRLHHDWLINLTAARHEGMYFLNVPLFSYRIHNSNAVGVPAVNRTHWERLKETNTMAIRTQLSEEGVATLQTLREIDPAFYHEHQKEFDDLADFYQKHTQYLQEGKFFKLLMQNRNPHYAELKTRNARIMDLIFVFENKFHRR